MTTEEPRIHWHWQNLDEDRDGKPKGSGLRHGRAWLHFGRDNLEIEWRMPSSSARLSFEVSSDSESTVSLSMALPPVSLHFGAHFWPLASWLYKLAGNSDFHRELSLKVFDWAVWWCLWQNPFEWRSGERGQGTWHPFGHPGSQVGEPEVRETREVLVPLPEGTYKATARREVGTMRSRLFPLLRERFSTVELDFGAKPVPTPGKGENSWDCGEDTINSSSMPAESIEQAIGRFIGSTLARRVRYGGRNWKPEAKPTSEVA